MSKDIPKQRLVNWKPYAAAKHGQEVAVEFAFSRILGGLDTVMKVYTTVAAYNMYIAGDAKGHTYYDVHHGKTQEEVHRDAKAYVGQLLENTTMRASQYDKSALQNNSLGRQFTRFWNESRNVINNVIGEGRSIKGDAKKMSDHAKAGDYMKANMAFNDAGGNMMTVFGIMMASQAFMNAARERDPFLTPEDKDEGEDGTLGGFIGYQLSNPGELASNYIGGTVPVLRDILYAADSADRDATPRFAVSVPLLAAFNDIAAARNIPGVVLTEIQDGATFMEAMSELKVKEQRALINTVGYMVGGLPGANQILKLNAWMEDEDISLPSLNFINQEFVKSVDTYVSSKRPNEEAEFQKLLELSEKGVTTLTDAMLDDLTLIRDQIAPLPKGEVLSQFGYDIIKQVESGGKWNATPGTSSAYGIYQFTEGTWKDQMATPEGRAAGLTLNGRLSKNPRQQEAAMKIFTKSNSIKLVKLNVPVNLETLYFAHHFGAWKAEYVYGPSIKNDKIKMSKKVLTSEVLTANPKLVTLKVRTVGDMKKYIRDILNDGKDELTNSQP
ncbi:transglycosylase family protein [Candidatus Babeliales bacterium]|nr:transglycosylase family protein [Candidatus Babeliales bacterium]